MFWAFDHKIKVNGELSFFLIIGDFRLFIPELQYYNFICTFLIFNSNSLKFTFPKIISAITDIYILGKNDFEPKTPSCRGNQQ